MAGKKGMKHARPKTKEERDEYALNAIESYIDTHVLKCEKCRNDMQIAELKPAVATLMMKRYDKLRATLSASEVKMRVETMSDVLKRISDEQIAAQHKDQPDPPVVTH